MTAIYDVIVRGGVVVDGTGRTPYPADIAIVGKNIIHVGDVDGSAHEEIDASGMIITPGFVDAHTHYDGQITWETRMAPSSNHGVTTVVMGNCGVGFAPVRPDDREIAVKLMEGVEDIPDVVMAEGLPWNWSSFPEYLDALEERKADVDFAAQLPHSPLRIYVMGQRGADLEPATAADLAEMQRLTTEAINAGALGVSTSRNLFHRFRSGALAPSVNSPEQELLALGNGLSDAGSGVFQCVLRLDGDPQQEFSVLRSVAQECGRPVNFSLVCPGEAISVFLSEMDEAAADGLDIKAHFLPRPLGVLFGIDLSYHPFSLNPSYRAIAHLPLAEKVARMRDPDFRRTLLAEKPDDPNPMFVQIVSIRSNLYALADPVDYCLRTEQSLGEQAKRLGVSIEEVIYDALLADDGHAIIVGFQSEPVDYIARTETLMHRDDSVFSLGDGGAHYGMICDAAYPTFALGQRLKPDHSNLPSIVRKLTRDPAMSVGLGDRGVIAPGYKADLNIIDLGSVMLYRPTVVADLPSGGKRLDQAAAGYRLTMLSGVITYRAGTATGALPGQLVRGARQVQAA